MSNLPVLALPFARQPLVLSVAQALADRLAASRPIADKTETRAAKCGIARLERGAFSITWREPEP